MLAHTLLALLPAVALAAPGKPLVSRGYPAAAPAAQPWQPAYAAPAPVAQEHPAPAQHETWQAQPAAPAWTPAAEHAAPQPPAQSEWPKHGSGSKPVADLDSCVQMCQATFGGGGAKPAAPPAGSAAPGPAPPPTPVQGGNGAKATHTVIVAPSQGVLRFVPFSVTANDGDTLKFVWGAGPHSATLSSGNNACSAADSGFESGNLNATATFETVVNGTTPKFHYCKVGMHCANGMFGIVNPPTTNVTTATPTVSKSAPGQGSTAGAGSGGCNPSRVDCWVSSWAASAPEASTTVAAVQKACERSQTRAWQWGAAIDMSNLLGDGVTQQNVVENVLYTRLMMSMNPSMLDSAPAEGNTTAAASTDAKPEWVVPPNLKDFVAQSNQGGDAAAAGASGAGAPAEQPFAGAGGSGDGYGGSDPAAASASPSGGNASSAGAAASSGATTGMTASLGLVVLTACLASALAL